MCWALPRCLWCGERTKNILKKSEKILHIIFYFHWRWCNSICIFILVISCGEVISVYIQKSVVIVSIHSYVFDRKTEVDTYLFYCIEKLCVLTWIRKCTHRCKVTWIELSSRSDWEGWLLCFLLFHLLKYSEMITHEEWVCDLECDWWFVCSRHCAYFQKNLQGI